MLFIFDMGGVVTSTCLLDRMYAKLGVTHEQYKQNCIDSDGVSASKKIDIGAISIQEFWKIYNRNAAAKGMKTADNDLFRMFFHPVLNPETVEIINLLKKNGHRVVCGTNTIQSHWENHMERGDYAFFDQTYASNKIGVAKPDIDFFNVILEAEDYKPEDAFFTDDKIENCEAAEKAGIKAHHFVSSKELYEAWKCYF